MTTIKLKIDQIVPNQYNPNRMSAEQFQSFVAEIKLNGDVFKPVVVRLVNSQYEIIDGEHSWRAAKEAGIEEITCEIKDIDDFEARRQTLFRNKHGIHNPLREALVYEQMIADRKLSNPKFSQRGLAKEIGELESTIRNRLKYLKVYRDYQDDRSDAAIERIGSLTQARIDMCVELSTAIGTAWLAAGANMKVKEWIGHSSDRPFEVRVREIKAAGLAGLLSTKDYEFCDQIRHAADLAEWARIHLGLLFPAAAYLQPMMRLNLPVGVLDALPRKINGGDVTVLLSPDKWSTLLAECAARGTDQNETLSFVRALIRTALREEGIDPLKIASPKELAQHEAVLLGPELVRSADFLSLDEQFMLTVFAQNNDSVTTQEAVQLTVEHFRQRRTAALGPLASTEPADDIHDVLDAIVDSLCKTKQPKSTGAPTPDSLVAQITQIMMDDEDGSPVIDESERHMLETRLSNVPLPELLLIASALDPDIETYAQVIDTWRAAVDRVSNV